MNFVLKSSKKGVGLYKGYYLKPSFLGLKTKVGLYTKSAYTPGFTVIRKKIALLHNVGKTDQFSGRYNYVTYYVSYLTAKLSSLI